MEIWKPIEDYDGVYEVSNFANVKSLKFGKEKLLKQRKKGVKKPIYTRVDLCKNGQTKTLRVHRLVAVSFVPNPFNLPCVNHLDNDSLNNHVTNLEWCTQRQNMSHAYTFKKTSSDYVGVSWSKMSKKWKAQIQANGFTKHIGYYENELDAANAYRNFMLENNLT